MQSVRVMALNLARPRIRMKLVILIEFKFVFRGVILMPRKRMSTLVLSPFRLSSRGELSRGPSPLHDLS